MKRYDKYKDSCISWIGEIPEHWKVKSLRNFLSLVSIKGHGDKQLLSVTRENGVIVRDIESKEENHNFIPDDLSGYKLVKEGQFVINKMKSWQGSYGVSKYTGIVSPAYYVCDLRFHNKDFFSLAIRSKAYVPFFTQYSKGIRVDQWDLSTNALKSIPFVVPNAEEQKEIVDYIIQKSANIDRYIEIKQKEINALDELKQSIIAETVTKGLDKNVVMKDSGIAWIGKVPKHWEEISLKNVFVDRVSGLWGNDINEGEVNKECIRIADFIYDKLIIQTDKGFTIRSYKNNDISCRSLNKGDLLIEKSGGGEKTPVGRTVIYDLDLENPMFANFMERLVVRKNINPYYINYYLSKLYTHRIVFKYIKQTTGIQNLDISSLLSNERIYIPYPIKEQKAIVDYINSKCEKIDKMKSSIEAQIAALKEYKQRLISDVVTGKRKVIE